MKSKFNKALVIKILIIAALVVGSSFLSIWAYHQYKELKKPLVPAINAIPANTAFFIEIKNYNELWSKLNQPYSLWKALTEIASFGELNKQIVFLDSLSKTNAEIADIINSQPFYIVITSDGLNDFNVLFMFDLAGKQQCIAIEKFFSHYHQNEYTTNDLTNNETPLFEMSSLKTGKKFYYSVYKGVFIAGLSKKEVFASATQLNSIEPLAKNEVFSKIYTTAGKNVDANFYLNLGFIHKLFSRILENDNSFLTEMKNISKGWLTLDIKMKENLFLLNGFTNIADTIPNILTIFKNEEPPSINVSSILPDNTSMFLFLGFNDYNKFSNSFSKLDKNNNRINRISEINHSYQIEIEKYFKYWVGKELVMFSTPNLSNDKETYNYLAINTTDKKTTFEKLNELAEKTEINTKRKNEGQIYKGYDIRQIVIPKLLSVFFGFMADNIQQNYFILLDNYVVFANSPEAIRQLIDKTALNQTLTNNTIYNSFVENLSDKASIYLYINIPGFLNSFIKLANKEYKADIEKNLNSLKQFQSFAFQIIPEKDLFYNTICFDYKTVSLKKPASMSWELELDTIGYGKPTVLRNFSDKSKEILITDANNQLYLINKDGKLIWKKQLKEKIISDIYQIDFYKNGKLQFLFNTESQIHLIGHNANEVEGYPVKLKSKASNGLLAVYYPDINDYRMYLACENKKVICLSKDAIQVDGWQFEKTENSVNKPLQHFIINNTDYLVFYDLSGKIYILDRKGMPKIEIKNNTDISSRNTFFINKTTKETSLVFSSKSGEINSIQIPGGKINRIKIKDFSPLHYFIFADLNNDKKKEYLFIDNSKLEIYNLAQKLIFNYQFINPVTSAPIIIEENEQILKFGILDQLASQLFLFTYSNNEFTQKETIPCNISFNIAHLTTPQQLNIITLFDNKVHNYVY